MLKIALRLRLAGFYVTITKNLESYFSYFNFETYFMKNENVFQKTEVPFFN